MSTIRRSSRGQKKQLKYVEADAESDDEESKLAAFFGEESGSDFEQDLKKKANDVTMMVKESSDDVSSGVDEKDISDDEHELPPVKTQRKRTINDLAVLKKTREKLLKLKSKKSLNNQEGQKSQYFQPTKSKSLVSSTLDLSESSSSEDDTLKPGPSKLSTKLRKSTSKLSRKPKILVQDTQKEKEVSEEEIEVDIDFASQLESLARSCTLEKTTNEKTKSSIVKKASPVKPLSSSDQIANLLAQGEGVTMPKLSDDDDDSETDDVVKEPTTSDTIAISIDVPGQSGLLRKRKKKGQFDMEAYVKRELGRAQRELQLLRHQGHVLCLCAHLRYLNSFVAFPPVDHSSAQVSLATALSIVPAAHNVPAREVTIVRLASFVSWFKGAFQIVPGDKFSFPDPLEEWLMRAMENYVCVSPVQRVLIFILAARSMGWPTRLVLNFDAVSMKPEKSLAGKLSEILGQQQQSSSQSTSSSKEINVEKNSPKKLKIEEKSTTIKNEKSANRQSPTKKIKTEEKEDEKANNVANLAKKWKDNTETSKESKMDSRPRSRSQKMKAKSSSQKTEKSSPKKTSRRSSRQPVKANEPEKKPSKESKKSSDKNPDKLKSTPEKKSEDRKKLSRQITDAKKVRLSDSALLEIERRKKAKKRETKSEYFNRRNSDDDSESDFEPESRKRKSPSKLHNEGEKKKKTSAKSKSKQKVSSKANGLPYWCEVYVTKSGWVTVDVDQGRVDCAKEMEERSGIKPLLYIIAANADGTLKDVTRRYAAERYDTQTRKARNPTESWLTEMINPFERKDRTAMDDEEDKQLVSISTSAPLPTTVGAFKSHPLYALSRHLLKFEAIYPPDAPPMGYIKSEPIYAREVVQSLQGRTSWLKEGRVVRIGQEPYKVVKARPKWDRMSGNVIKDQPLEVFGRWQTEIFIPPPAVDGKIPRNEYGNVELFKPWMLPKGTVHIPISGLNRVSKKLDIDCAPAMVGWEFSGVSCHPVFDGFVVCEEHQDILMDAWNADEVERERRAHEKKTKRACDNWRKLTRAMLMYEKIRKKYAKKEAAEVVDDNCTKT